MERVARASSPEGAARPQLPPVGVSSAAPADVADRAALCRCAAGDASGLRHLADRHGAGLLAYLTGVVGDSRLAEELVQDTLLGAWRGASGFVGGSTVRTWLFAIARRRTGEVLRRRSPLISLEADNDLVTVADVRPGPERVAVASARLTDIATALRALSAPHREVILLTCVHEMSMAEASAVIGVPVGTVKSRLSNARIALGRALGVSESEDPGVD